MKRINLLIFLIILCSALTAIYFYMNNSVNKSDEYAHIYSSLKQVDINDFLDSLTTSVTETSTEYTSEMITETSTINESLDLIKGFIEKYNNTDIIGYIKVPDTRIDYPVVWYPDNSYYLEHDYNKNKSKAAAIFMDFENNIELDDLNTILYGHNMKNKTMFGDLVVYKKYDFFTDHKIIQFDTLRRSGKYEVFSCYVWPADVSYLTVNFRSEEEFSVFANELKRRSMYDTGIEVTEKDEILTLSTCSYESNNVRFVVHAKRI